MEPIFVFMYAYVFLFGICIASFLNVVIWRVPLKLSIAKGRSYCPSCNQTLKWYDLVPIVSYLFLRGKCRYCNAKIPVRDTIIEVIGGIIAVYCFYLFQFSWESVVVFVIAILLLGISMIDFDTMTIPNGLLIVLCIPVLFMCFIHPEITLLERIIGFFAISLPMYLLILSIPDCFGGGDVKLIAIGGLLLGWQSTLLAGFIAIFIGGFYAITLLLRKKTKKDQHIAFGPYLCIGILIALLYGDCIIKFYLSMFNF